MAISTSFKQECPICEALVPIRDPKLVGKKVKCPKCEGTFVVREPPPAEGEDESEEGITSTPSKKSKTAGNGKVTDKKPQKAGAKKGKSDKDESDGDDKGKKKKKKDDKTKLGLILAGVAVAVLGVGGYFMFRGGDSKGKGKGQQTQQQQQQGTNTEEKKDDKKADDKGATTKKNEDKNLVDPTALIPADATAVFSINIEDLKNSRLWAAALPENGDGAFRAGAFETAFGFPLFSHDEGVARVITATNKKADWVFSVVRTAHAIDQDDLKKRLKLEAVAGQPYFLLGRQFDNIGNLLFKANRPRDTYAAYFVDAKTIVFADVDPLSKYLAEKTTAEKKDTSSGPYQNLSAELKALLEKVETGNAPALICLAGDVDTAWAAALPMLPALVKHGAQKLAKVMATNPLNFPNVEDFPKQVKDAGSKPEAALAAAKKAATEDVNNAAVALASFQDKIDLTVALEMKNDRIAESWKANITQVLDWWGNAPANPMTPMGMGMGEQPKKDVPLTVNQSGKIITATFATSIKSDYKDYTGDLAKALVQVRGDSELANTAPRYHQLAAALMKYVEKNDGKFPRGITAPRKNARDGDPEYRHPDACVSWMAALLPDFGGANPSKEWYRDENLAVAQTVVPHFVVRGKDTAFKSTFPGLPGEFGVTHFVGMAGLGQNAATDECAPEKMGIFGYTRVTKLADIPKERQDKVIAVIQVPPEYRCPWLAGGGATVRGVDEKEKDPVKPFVAAVNKKAERGTFAIMADGKVRFIPATIDARLFRSMCVIKAPTDKDVLDLLSKFNELVPEVPDEEVIVKVISGAADKPGQEKSPEKPKDKPSDKTLPDKTPTDNPKGDKRGTDMPQIDTPKPIKIGPKQGAG
jgi:hypothetical protein